MIGETLAQYRIETRLGAGGMGVVYRAEDQRLHRTVAIKVVGGAGGGSTPEDRSRLLDEARAASGLNHPNICTVYEVGEAAGRVFIAMEYVEGQPLSQSVPHGGFSTEAVVRYGVQIADALAHAHERGVVHRDLKTANIVLSGQVGAKILDFGLARRVDVRSADAATRSLETIEPATLVGTLAYIAPEVLLGQPGGTASDIWSLGVVLYEIATGDLPFKGRNEFDLTAAILRAPAQPFPAHVPPMLRAIVLRCLAKEPAQRYRRAGEVRAALEAIQSDVSVPPPVAQPRRRPRGSLLTIAGALTIVGLLAAWMLGRDPDGGPWERTAADGRLTRVVSTDDRTSSPAISPDGRLLCYVLETRDGRVDLYAGRVSGGAHIRLTDDDAREAEPRFSPDGERIAFMRRAGAEAVPEIRIVPALGGEAIATIPQAGYPAWAPDGRRLAYLRRSGTGQTELTVAAPDGSDARVVMRSDSVYPFLRNPAWSPDGREIAVVRGTGGIAAEIWLVPSAGGAPRRVMEEPAAVFSDWPVFTPDGRGIVHTSNRGGATNIWFLSLAAGRPVRLTTGPGPDESPTVAADGTIAFVNSRWRNTLEVHDLSSGSSRTLHSHAPFIWAPAVSPDGRHIAFSRSEVDGSWHIWTVDVEDGAPRRLTSTEGGEVYPRWTPDGASLLFHTWSAPRRIGRVPAQGGPPVMLSFEPPAAGETFADISPDGRLAAFTRSDAQAERIYVAPAGGGAARLLTPSPGTVPKWSPEGSHIAFAGHRGYAGGIFLIAADGTGERRLSPDGGWPVWFPDGRRIGYVAAGRGNSQEIRIAPLDGGPPETLTSIRFEGSNHPFDVSRDGRLLVVSNAVHVSDEIWLLEPPR